MNKRTWGRSLAALLAVWAVSANGQLARFDGKWVNLNPDTRHITTIDLLTVGEKVRLRVHGRCHPDDCDWGWVTAEPYTPDGVSADVEATASAIVATYERSFATKVLVIRFDTPATLTTLTVASFTKFNDDSGRSSTTGLVRMQPLRSSLNRSARRNDTALSREELTTSQGRRP